MRPSTEAWLDLWICSFLRRRLPCMKAAKKMAEMHHTLCFRYQPPLLSSSVILDLQGWCSCRCPMCTLRAKGCRGRGSGSLSRRRRARCGPNLSACLNLVSQPCELQHKASQRWRHAVTQLSSDSAEARAVSCGMHCQRTGTSQFHTCSAPGGRTPRMGEKCENLLGTNCVVGTSGRI